MKATHSTMALNDEGARIDLEAALKSYETALNASDVEAVMAAFAPDAVFMAPNHPSVVGAEPIRWAYTALFQNIGFETNLTVEEVMQVSPDWAIVRTRSAGFVNVRAIGQRVPDANHELFVFHKGDDSRWKIARYSFSTTQPLAQ